MPSAAVYSRRRWPGCDAAAAGNARLKAAMPARPHILVVNGRKVRQPVFVIGAPHSGTDLLARALKQSDGFHVTMGKPAVLSVVHAFARSPSIQRGRGEAATTVLRDAFAQAWQVSAHGCMGCSPPCREAGQVDGAGICVAERDIVRYGDASPDLIYCADGLVDAFPDARIVQIIRDGRDVVAGMLGDSGALSWFSPGVANVESEFPNPFFGIETEEDREAWPQLSPSARCALRWRWSVRLAAGLHHGLPAGQLKTLRYEHLMSKPDEVLSDLSKFVGVTVAAAEIRNEARTLRTRGRSRGAPTHQRSLGSQDIAQVEKIAGEELRRLGYTS